MYRQLTFLVGNRHNKNNVFRWNKVVINLPGSAGYNPARPRVYKVREDLSTMAADIFIYINNVRNTAPSERDYWKGAHQVCCRKHGLGFRILHIKGTTHLKLPEHVQGPLWTAMEEWLLFWSQKKNGLILDQLGSWTMQEASHIRSWKGVVGS